MKFLVKMTGRTPLVMHNNRCVDPLNPLTKEIKAITGKRKKTDADHEQIRLLEFQAGIYHSDRTGPFIPAKNLRKMLIEAARKSKDGKQFESGCWLIGDSPLQYDGPKSVQELYEDGRFVWTTVVGNQSASIMRTRPKFDSWEATIEIETDPVLVSPEMLQVALHHAENAVGILDARSIGMGRFHSEILSQEDVKPANGRVRKSDLEPTL